MMSKCEQRDEEASLRCKLSLKQSKQWSKTLEKVKLRSPVKVNRFRHFRCIMKLHPKVEYPKLFFVVSVYKVDKPRPTFFLLSICLSHPFTLWLPSHDHKSPACRISYSCSLYSYKVAGLFFHGKKKSYNGKHVVPVATVASLQGQRSESSLCGCMLYVPPQGLCGRPAASLQPRLAIVNHSLSVVLSASCCLLTRGSAINCRPDRDLTPPPAPPIQ